MSEKHQFASAVTMLILAAIMVGLVLLGTYCDAANTP